MAKLVDNSVLDGAFLVMDNATRQTLCSSQPANYAAIGASPGSGVNLGQATMVATTDYTKADGDTSGRKCTVAAKTISSGVVAGTVTHLALDDGTTLLYVTTCTSQVLAAGNTVNIPAWKVEIADPT